MYIINTYKTTFQTKQTNLSFNVEKLRNGTGCVEGQFGLEVDVVVAVQLLLLRVALPTRAGRREALRRRLVQRHVSKHEQKRVQKKPPSEIRLFCLQKDIVVLNYLIIRISQKQ